MASVRLTILTLHNKSILSTHQVTMIHCIVGNLDQNSKGLRHGDKSFYLGYNQQDWKWRMLVTYTSIEFLLKLKIFLLQEFTNQGKHCLHFVKLHAPWNVVSNMAMDLNLRAPIQVIYKVYNNYSKVLIENVQVQPNPRTNWSEKLLTSMCIPNMMSQSVPNIPPDYYTAPFRAEKLDKFLGNENKQNFFTRAQRSRIVFEILSTIVFGKEKKGEVGIDRLVEEGVFSAAYPLHDVITVST